MLTRTQAEAILKIDIIQEKVKVTRGETGPAYLDAWLMLFKRKDIWMKTEPVASKQVSKEIIWCVPADAVSDIPFVRSFITAITTYYNVYLWPGNNKALRNVRPISNTDEFLEKMSSTVPATLQQATETLGYQGLQTDNYIIIDENTLVNMVRQTEIILRRTQPEKYYQDYVPTNWFHPTETELDLRDIKFKTFEEEIYPAISADKIESISTFIFNENELKLYKQMFPNLSTITIEGADGEWLAANIHHFDQMNLQLEKFIGNKEIVIPENCKVKTLYIKPKDAYRTKYLSAAPGATVESLELNTFNRLVCNIHSLNGIKKLSVKSTETYVSSSITFKMSVNDIEELHISACYKVENLDFSLLPKLKHLNYEIPSADLNFPNLKKRTILDYLLCRDYRLTNPLLETVTINYAHSNYAKYNTVIDLKDQSRLKTVKLNKPLLEQVALPRHTEVLVTTFPPKTYPDNKFFYWDMYGNKVEDKDYISNKGKILVAENAKSTKDGSTDFSSLKSVKKLHIQRCELFPEKLPPLLKVLEVEDRRSGDVALTIRHATLMRFNYERRFRSDNIKIDIDAPNLERLFIDASQAQVSFHRLNCPNLKSLHLNCANAEMHNVLLKLPDNCTLVSLQTKHNKKFIRDYRHNNPLCIPGIRILNSPNNCLPFKITKTLSSKFMPALFVIWVLGTIGGASWAGWAIYYYFANRGSSGSQPNSSDSTSTTATSQTTTATTGIAPAFTSSGGQAATTTGGVTPSVASSSSTTGITSSSLTTGISAATSGTGTGTAPPSITTGGESTFTTGSSIGSTVSSVTGSLSSTTTSTSTTGIPSISPSSLLPTTPPPTTTPGQSDEFSTTTILLIVGAGTLLLTMLIAAIILYKRYTKNANNLGMDYTYLDGDTDIFGEDEKGAAKKKNTSYKHNFYLGQAYFKHHTREGVQNTAEIENNQLMLYSKVEPLIEVAVEQVDLKDSQEALRKVMVNIDANRNEGLGQYEAKLKKGVLYPLPTIYPILNPTDIIKVYNEQPNSVKFYFHEVNQQLYIMRNDDVKVKDDIVKFFYQCKLDKRYLLKDAATPGSTAKIYQTDPAQLLPARVIRDVRKHLEKTPEYNYLLSNNITVNEKLCRLIATLRDDFNAGKLTVIPNDPIDRLFQILKEHKGVCRHRSEAMFILARFLGVPVVNPGNRKHVFGCIPFLDEKGKMYYQRVDTCWDTAPEINRDMSVFLDLMKVPEGELREIVIDNDPEVAKKKAVMEIYKSNLKAAVTKSAISSLDPILASRNRFKSPLIRLTGKQTEFTVNEQLLLHLEMTGLDVVNKHLYINSPNEFEHYLNPNVITNNEITTVPGPLQRILKDPVNLSVVVINWANFTPREGATYQSMLDTNPLLTIGETTYQISNKTLVFGIIKDAYSLGEAFISRNKQWELTDKFFRDKPVYQRSGGTPRTIDTFHLQNWREKLFGDILINGERYIIGEAQLLEAIAYNVPLIVYNPPDDEEFRLLMHHVNDERKLFHNGEFIKIPNNVVILTQEKENNLQLSNVKIINKDARANRQLIHIDIQNLHELMKQFIVNKENNKGKTLRGGLLEAFNPAKEIFYIHGFIPKDYWQEVLAYIKKIFPDKVFNFELAPGAEIENIAKERHASAQMVPFSQLLTYPGNLISTNDCDYVTTVLKRRHKNATVIRLTPRTSFTEHIVDIKRIPNTKSDFLYTEHGVLQQLIAGKTVILSGEIPIALYFQLLPLLSDRPHIYANGKRIDVDGKLIIVTPSQTADGKLQPDLKCDLSMEDYRYLLCKNEEANLAFDRINMFYDFIKRMPHKGPGRPPIPELNYQRIKKIMEQSERPTIHSHNPIKGLLNYDYPRRSDEQNYINVLGKYIFSHQDKSTVRIGKLNLLLREHKINTVATMKPYIWQLLNCFSGAELHLILGENLNAAIDNTGFPQLTPDVLSRFLETLNTYRTNDHYFKVAKENKSKRQLVSLLEDNAKPIILLKGAPGVGKTYAIRGAIKDYFEGEDKIINWLTAADKGKPIIFLWDEANKELAGTLDFIIKGLASEDRTVYYKDKPYQLSPNHKFILTANPETFPNRYYHSAIQEYAETIYLDKPDDTALEKHANARLDSKVKKFSPSLVYACRLVEKYNPFLPMSLRDIENLACRANMLCAIHKTLEDDSIKEQVFYACVYEFSGSIKDPALRKLFITELKSKMALNHLPDYQTTTNQVYNGKFYPPSKSYMVDSLQQDFVMRMRAIKNAALAKADDPKNPVDYKQAIIVEGEPGVGKSTFFRAMVAHYKEQLQIYRDKLISELKHMQPSSEKTEKELELAIVTKEYNKPVVEISVGPGAVKALKTAYKDEVILIGDEANLDPDFEKELNQILSGVDENKVPVRRPGFIFLGSQNSSKHGGRMNVDEALRNRTRLLYQDENTRADLVAYAKYKEIPYPEVYVDVFTQIKKEYPHANTRTFYDTLDDIAKDTEFRDKFSEDIRGSRQFSINDDPSSEREPLLDHRKQQ